MTVNLTENDVDVLLMPVEIEYFTTRIVYVQKVTNKRKHFFINAIINNFNNFTTMTL